MEEYTQIKISRFLSDKFLSSKFHLENPAVSLTQLMNSLLELFLDEKMVRLEETNFEAIKKCGDELNKTTKDIVNMVLERIEIVAVVNPPKIQVDLHPDHHHKVKINKKMSVNTIKNW